MGRLKGKGLFAGGRKKSPFAMQGKLPPIRCSESLQKWVEEQAKNEEVSTSAYMRRILMNEYRKAKKERESMLYSAPPQY